MIYFYMYIKYTTISYARNIYENIETQRKIFRSAILVDEIIFN